MHQQFSVRIKRKVDSEYVAQLGTSSFIARYCSCLRDSPNTVFYVAVAESFQRFCSRSRCSLRSWQLVKIVDLQEVVLNNHLRVTCVSNAGKLVQPVQTRVICKGIFGVFGISLLLKVYSKSLNFDNSSLFMHLSSDVSKSELLHGPKLDTHYYIATRIPFENF